MVLSRLIFMGIARFIYLGLLSWVTAVGLIGCGYKQQSDNEKYQAARVLFENTTKNLHIPSAEAKGAERIRLQTEAARGYQLLVTRYSDQDFWAAQALRSLGNIRASQTNLNAAVKCYSQVAERYPKQEWEVVMAWKSAGDLLWEARRYDDARKFYRKIVVRFDTAEVAPVIKTVVRGSKSRLGGGLLLTAREVLEKQL